MKVVHTSKVRKEFAETVNKVVYLKERVILERHGKEIAALIPIEDFRKYVVDQKPCAVEIE